MSGRPVINKGRTIKIRAGEIAELQVEADQSASTKRARGRPKETPISPATPSAFAKRARERPRKTLIALATPSASAKKKTNAPPKYLALGDYPTSSSTPLDHYASSICTTSKRGRGRGCGNGSTTSYKRSIVIGIGVFQAKNGIKALNVIVFY
ncbi:hypothetical protein H5410_015845 [Solanum commersonii]|uniref:Uncharacterized protein n=1 Tax=Solanum commersonii TaxID=4109 RepID=A0A9J5ZUL8_SOLCO|nr:hypothetical protein H5410_015845 [Solanum commersonii]